MNIKQKKRQHGLTLIELMIAVTLSTFIVAAMIGLFVNSKENYRMNENMSRLQENARFAVSFLANDLRMTDYRACTTVDRLPNSLSGVNNAGLNESDTVTILWQSNGCAAAQSTVTTTYYIQNGQSGGPSLFRNIDGTDQELVEGIQSLQILYGLDTSGDNSPNLFTDDPTLDLSQAVAVRVNLVAQTLESNLAADGGAISRTFRETVTLRNRLP